MSQTARPSLHSFLIPDLRALGDLVAGLAVGAAASLTAFLLTGPLTAVGFSLAAWSVLTAAFLCRRYRGFCQRFPDLVQAAQLLDTPREPLAGVTGGDALGVLKSLLNQSNEGLFIIDPATSRVLEVNEQACRNLGLPRDELVGREVPTFVANYAPGAAAWDEHLARLRAEGNVLFESRHRRSDGSEFPVEVSSRLVTHLGQEYLVSVARDLTERKQREAELERLATTDPLTGTANRRLFRDRTEHHLALFRRRATPFAVILMDLDHFKQVNDRHGHDVGDRVLMDFATLVAGELRESDLLARTGGEEFALLAPATDMEGALGLCGRISERLATAAPGGLAGITTSFGAAEVLPGEDREELLRRADQALYAAKEGGRNRIEPA